MSAERPFLKQSFAGLVDATLANLRSGAGGRVVLDDGSEGSVLRTLVEAFSRELAVCYEQLEAVYQAGYLDTASGTALERVVELLGVERHQAGWLEGDVVFSRTTPATYTIDIPAGTLVAGKGVQGFETLAPAKLESGERSVRVPVRSLVPEGEGVDPGRLTLLKRPIAGIESATNPGLLLPRREPESDGDLRSRARHAIHGGRTATVSALERAVLALGIVEVSVSEDPARPGLVNVVLGDVDLTPAEIAQAAAAIEEIRPAGVRVNSFAAKPVSIRVRAIVVLDQELDTAAELALRSELEAAIQGYFGALVTNETVRWTKIRNLLTANPLVAEVSTPRVGEPGVPTWPLEAVDPSSGKPLIETTAPRLLGSAAAPVGVFVGGDERARLSAIELELQPPRLPVWIDVEVALAMGEVASPQLEQQLRVALGVVLPSELLVNAVSVSWSDLVFRTASKLADRASAYELASLRLVILHDRDGRVVTVADDPRASDEATFAIREQIELRNINLIAAAEA